MTNLSEPPHLSSCSIVQVYVSHASSTVCVMYVWLDSGVSSRLVTVDSHKWVTTEKLWEPGMYMKNLASNSCPVRHGGFYAESCHSWGKEILLFIAELDSLIELLWPPISTFVHYILESVGGSVFGRVSFARPHSCCGEKENILLIFIPMGRITILNHAERICTLLKNLARFVQFHHW